MKRTFLIPLTALVLASMACALFGKTEKPAILPTVTQPAVKMTKAVAATMPKPTETQERPTETQERPTATQEKPTATEAPTSIPTDMPTDTPAGPVEYVDSFDHNQDSWSEDFIVTSQTSGQDLYSKGVIQDGALRFSFMDKETYMYKFFQAATFGNVTIEADYESSGHINNGIAIVCKVNEERTQWYEARVSSTSDFSFYLYDKKRKTELGKNPYLQIGKGKFKINELYPAKPNTIQLTCLDNELILNANHDKRVISQALDTTLEGSGVGLGAMSYDVVPININFGQVTIREEK